MPPESEIGLAQQCASHLGLTRSEVYAIARNGPKRYKVYEIPKRTGGSRIICQPSRELKALQYFFLRKILIDQPVHHAATAYRPGGSIRANARAHINSRVLLKLDFHNFFNSITTEDWLKYIGNCYPQWKHDDVAFSAFTMFWGAGGYNPVCLSIGAPTSPILSNIIMRRFDEIISNYAAAEELIYTRYADDITISSQGYLRKEDVVRRVRLAISESGGPKLILNDKKTYLASKSRARRVTGLILSAQNQVSLGRDRKRLISAMVNHAVSGTLAVDERSRLQGLLAFAADVEPTFAASIDRKYGRGTVSSILAGTVIKVPQVPDL